MKLNGIGIGTKTYLKNNNNILVTKELWNAGLNNKMGLTLINNVMVSLGLTLPPNFYT